MPVPRHSRATGDKTLAAHRAALPLIQTAKRGHPPFGYPRDTTGAGRIVRFVIPACVLRIVYPSLYGTTPRFSFHRSNFNLNDTTLLNSHYFSILTTSQFSLFNSQLLRAGTTWRTLCAATHPRRRGGHRPPARAYSLPVLSLRASDRCHWRGNPFPLAFRLSPALRFMAGWHACRRPDFLIAQKVSKDAPGRGKIPNLSPLPDPLSPFKRPNGVIPLLDIPEIPPTLSGPVVP